MSDDTTGRPRTTPLGMPRVPGPPRVVADPAFDDLRPPDPGLLDLTVEQVVEAALSR